jgi:thiol-disulfide isomerase/thioredoxin
MQGETKKIFFYYANWCGHCNSFKPEWKKIKDQIDGLADPLISYAEYEDGANPKIMENEGIRGYPTIKMKFGNKTMEYNGPRNAESIMGVLRNTVSGDEANDDASDHSGGQCGGGQYGGKKSKYLTRHELKIKYMKYKTKHLKQLAELNEMLDKY